MSRHIILPVFIILWQSLAAQQREPVYYTVQPQEGLYRVAVKNNVTMEQIRQWNNLASDNLSLGQRLIVGYRDSPDAPRATQTTEDVQQTFDSGRKPIHYTVQPQEGLYRVAVKNNVTMAEIRSWNNLTSDQLSVGQRLIVGYEIAGPEITEEPVNMQVQYEETLAKGNRAFEEKNYEEAMKYFNEALAINPDSYYGKKRLAEIDAILSPPSAPETAASRAAMTGATTVNANQTAQTEEVPPPNPFGAFWFYVKKGDADLSAGNHEAALANYKEAEKIYPTKPYPKTKIKEIEEVLKQQQAAEVTEPDTTSNEPDSIIPPGLAASVNELLEPVIMAPDTQHANQFTPWENTAEGASGNNSTKAETYFAVLKSKPTDFGKVVEYIPENSEVTLLDFNGTMRNYFKVRFNESTGWVTGRNIKMTKEVKMFRSKIKAIKKSSQGNG